MKFTSLALAMGLAGAFVSSAHSAQIDLVPGSEAVKWAPAPPAFPKGAEIAVLSGNPFASGPYVVRVKMPANYQIPAHHHSMTENVTIVSGTFHAGMGDKLDHNNAQDFGPGGFVAMPAGMNHYAWASSETVLQIHGDGPFDIAYVNAADDPRK